jgi:hypothetical protein
MRFDQSFDLESLHHKPKVQDGQEVLNRLWENSRALMSIDNATCENATRVSARIPITDVSLITDVQQPLTDRKNGTMSPTVEVTESMLNIYFPIK